MTSLTNFTKLMTPMKAETAAVGAVFRQSGHFGLDCCSLYVLIGMTARPSELAHADVQPNGENGRGGGQSGIRNTASGAE